MYRTQNENNGKKGCVFAKFEEVYPVHNKNIKYTKLPDYDFDTQASWNRDSYVLPPRLRRIIGVDDTLIAKRSSLVFEEEIPQQNEQQSCNHLEPSTTGKTMCSRKKIITMTEDNEDIAFKYNNDIRKTSITDSLMGTEPMSDKMKNISQMSMSRQPKKKTNSKNSYEPSSSNPKMSNYQNISSKRNFNSNRLSSPNRNFSPSRFVSQNQYVSPNRYVCPIRNISPTRSITPNRLISPVRSISPPHQYITQDMNISPTESDYIGMDFKGIGTMSKSRTVNPKLRSTLNRNYQKTENIVIIDHTKNRFDTKPRYLFEKSVKKMDDNHRNRNVDIISEVIKKVKPTSTIHVPLENNRNENKKKREIKLHKNVKEVTIAEKDEVDVIDVHKSPYFRKVNYDTEIMMGLKDEVVDCGVEANKSNKDIKNTDEKNTETADNAFEKHYQTTDLARINSADFERMLQDINSDCPLYDNDNLNVPNVSLLNERIEDISRSLPNLQLPADVVITTKKSKKNNLNSNSTSYLIGHAILTYTTEKKIDFHVVGNKDGLTHTTNKPYPINVVSVLRKEMNENNLLNPILFSKYKKEKENDQSHRENKYSNLLKSDCHSDSSKLVKPSEIIRAMRVKDNILQTDFLCEQFQRELNFIDSFFESLQFLENSSLSKNNFKKNKLENWAYSSLCSKLETCENNEETTTMASKSLCLLNLLIRDEQRRAKNLLMVLKMREDALKDFTKSHIMWLENKKKQDNTDIAVSTLKKKQRGALLKLQHECGEMQRMRKALLTLSEKRKLALMKTKKIIELKLNNHVNTDQIGIRKKKIKRNTIFDRNTAPLKCFDLSSSGCEDSNTCRPKSDSDIHKSEETIILSEKSIQTNDSVAYGVRSCQGNDASAKDCVTVDGSYLNILFQNLTLPSIFSGNKTYEVNEEALKSIVNLSMAHQSNVHQTEEVDRFPDQTHNIDLDRSSSPSTARSLVEEFDQYYKDLIQENRLETPDQDKICNSTKSRDGILTADSCLLKNKSQVNENSAVLWESQSLQLKHSDHSNNSQAEEPLTPLEEKASLIYSDTTTNSVAKLNDSTYPESDAVTIITKESPSLAPLPAPVLHEAEELRRQQLAIEKEIKALEQQQSLLVVREIPDKPPPPYTPPADGKTQKPLNTLSVNDITEHQIYSLIVENHRMTVQPADAFELFISDFCEETVSKHKNKRSEEPWESCNLLPQKSQLSREQLAMKATAELKEILTGTKPTIVSGVSARRADHIDDILFSEWRRCEPQWTTLHVDETSVKNQLFESIFQKIIDETIDEYTDMVSVRKD